MLTIHVWPRRLKEFLLTHPLYKSPDALRVHQVESRHFCRAGARLGCAGARGSRKSAEGMKAKGLEVTSKNTPYFYPKIPPIFTPKYPLFLAINTPYF